MSVFRKVLIVALLAAGIGAGVKAEAACKEAFFSCNLGDHDSDGSIIWRNTNLRSLRAGGRKDDWIAKKCKVAYADPPGCNWRGGFAAPSGGGASIVLSSPTAAPAANPAVAAAPPKRDAWGKRSPTPAPPAAVAPISSTDTGIYGREIAQAALRYKLPAQLIRAVMQVESGGNPEVVSGAGAVGLMQLLPATAAALGVEEIRNPAQNIMGGARFLRVLANRFDGDMVKVLSGYHAGSMRVLSRDATPFAATDDYVRKVLKVYYHLRDAAVRGSEAG